MVTGSDLPGASSDASRAGRLHWRFSPRHYLSDPRQCHKVRPVIGYMRCEHLSLQMSEENPLGDSERGWGEVSKTFSPETLADRWRLYRGVDA